MSVYRVDVPGAFGFIESENHPPPKSIPYRVVWMNGNVDESYFFYEMLGVAQLAGVSLADLESAGAQLGPSGEIFDALTGRYRPVKEVPV